MGSDSLIENQESNWVLAAPGERDGWPMPWLKVDGMEEDDE